MKKKNDIIIFATYRNEISRIEASLKQIEEINPVEVIICDGCFDSKHENRSTDGTREIIKERVSKKENARMISAIRVPNKLVGMLRLFRWFRFNNFIRLYTVWLSLLENIYRINQALTFNHMRDISKHWMKWWRFMNYDADQFYSDEAIEWFKKYCNNNKYWLLTANENTFFNDFDTYTDKYEKRDFNNMPHRIYKNTFIRPTRDNHREYMFSRKYYKDDNNVKVKSVWTYNHYKFKPNDDNRFAAGYTLWNRKAPDLKKYLFKKYKWKHSTVIIKTVLNKI